MTNDLPFDGTYPADDDYWVPPGEAHEYPPRYGDLFATPDSDEFRDSKGKLWSAVMAVHPSCEMGDKGAPDGIQVVRVYLLRQVSIAQRDEIRTGFRVSEEGIRLARVNTAYLAPPPEGPKEELYADFRKTARIPSDKLLGGRHAAMTHNARLAVLRREIYFRYRWDLPIEELLRLEHGRISNDPSFRGPRPNWA